MVLEQLDIHMKKKLDYILILHNFTKFNSKWIIDLIVKHKSYKTPRDDIRDILAKLGFDDDFQIRYKAH